MPRSFLLQLMFYYEDPEILSESTAHNSMEMVGTYREVASWKHYEPSCSHGLCSTHFSLNFQEPQYSIHTSKSVEKILGCTFIRTIWGSSTKNTQIILFTILMKTEKCFQNHNAGMENTDMYVNETEVNKYTEELPRPVTVFIRRCCWCFRKVSLTFYLIHLSTQKTLAYIFSLLTDSVFTSRWI